MSDSNGDEPLGYKRPPKWTRFQKGKSGNAKGRPKKCKQEQKAASPPVDSELDRLQREALDQELTVTEGGITKKRKASEVVMKSQINNAIKGQPLSQRDVLKNARELEQREARREAEQQELAEEQTREKMESEQLLFDYFARLKQSQAKAWSKAQAEGKDEPDFPWPHPDDIMLDEGRKHYRLRGPLDASDVALFEFQRAERDVAFMRMMVAIKARRKADRVTAEFWALIFGMYDAQMPKRWKIGDDFDLMIALHYEFTLGELREILAKDQRRSARWKILSGSTENSKEGYKVANTVMKPILKRQGYKSLAQFERAYEDTDGNPPWPKRG